MLEAKVLIGKLVTVDRLAAGAVVVGEVTTLQHEAWDDAVERRALEAKTLLAGAQGAEVLGRLRYDVGAKFHHNAASRLVGDSNVEEALGVGHDDEVVAGDRLWFGDDV